MDLQVLLAEDADFIRAMMRSVVQAAVAAYGTPLTFRVTVDAPGLPPGVQETLRSEMAKAAAAFAEPA